MCYSIARDVARQEEQVPTFLCLQGIPELAPAAPAIWRLIVQIKMCRRSIMSAVFVISNRHGSSIIRGLGAVRITNGSLDNGHTDVKMIDSLIEVAIRRRFGCPTTSSIPPTRKRITPAFDRKLFI